MNCTWGLAWWSTGQDSASNARIVGSIPGQGRKTPYAPVAQPIKERKKERKLCLIHIYEAKMIKMNKLKYSSQVKVIDNSCIYLR